MMFDVDNFTNWRVGGLFNFVTIVEMIIDGLLLSK